MATFYKNFLENDLINIIIGRAKTQQSPLHPIRPKINMFNFENCQYPYIRNEKRIIIRLTFYEANGKYIIYYTSMYIVYRGEQA